MRVEILEWNPTEEGMEQTIEVDIDPIAHRSIANALMAEFNRQYGGGFFSDEGPETIQIDSKTHFVAWQYTAPKVS